MKVSHSMLVSADKCEKRFEFEHVYRIKPKDFPEAMARGLAGHDMMEAFFKCMLEGGDYDECVEAVNPTLEKVVTEPYKLAVYRHVLAFGAYVFAQEWKPISVEQNYQYETPLNVTRVEYSSSSDESYVNDPIVFAFTPDIIFEWAKGPRRGYRFMLDFKFTGQYWSDRELAVYQQLPKYVHYFNQLHPDERPIKHAALVMLNTRAATGVQGNQLFMVKWIDLKPQKLLNIVSEGEARMEAVANWRAQAERGEKKFTRTPDTYACKMCFFADDICPMELNGQDITRSLERNYELNTYFSDNYGTD